MQDLAPDIYRQRMIVEGILNAEVNETQLEKFLKELGSKLHMTIIYGPVVFDLAGKVNPAHKGFEALVVWAESGAQLYTWKTKSFFTLDIFSCKEYSHQKVISLIESLLPTTKLAYKAI